VTKSSFFMTKSGFFMSRSDFFWQKQVGNPTAAAVIYNNEQATAQCSQQKMTISCARKSKLTESWF